MSVYRVISAMYFFVIGLKMTEISLHTFTLNTEKHEPKKDRIGAVFT